MSAKHLTVYAGPLGQAASLLSLGANGLSLANEINKGDGGKILVSGFKFGTSALDVIDKFILPGNPWLQIGTETCKVLSSGIVLLQQKDEG